MWENWQNGKASGRVYTGRMVGLEPILRATRDEGEGQIIRFIFVKNNQRNADKFVFQNQSRMDGCIKCDIYVCVVGY